MYKERIFAQLRELLSNAPSEVAFDNIFDFFVELEESEDKELAVQYALPHLEHWPDAFREGGRSCVWPDFPEGEPLDFIRIIRVFWFRTQIARSRDRVLLDGGLEVLGHSKHLSHLHTIDLFGNILGDERIQSFLQTPLASTLRGLNLGYNDLSDEGLKMLATSHHLQNFEFLRLGWHRHFTTEGFKAFAQSHVLSHLKALGLQRSGLTSENLAPLLHTSSSPCLTQLWLGQNNLDDKTLEVLATPGLAERLTFLSLEGNRFSADGIQRFLGQAKLTGLKELDLSESAIGDEGIRALVNSPHITKMSRLMLNHCDLTDESAKLLANAQNFQELKILFLPKRISEDGVSILRNSKHLRNIEYICTEY